MFWLSLVAITESMRHALSKQIIQEIRNIIILSSFLLFAKWKFGFVAVSTPSRIPDTTVMVNEGIIGRFIRQQALPEIAPRARLFRSHHGLYGRLTTPATAQPTCSQFLNRET